jgi:cyclophilin family peptidyl-prolyl cis-trans isomerase
MKRISLSFIVFAAVLRVMPVFAQYSLPPLKTYEVSRVEVKKMERTKAVVKTKFGMITLRFFPDVAPQHVKNFLDLARQGFYNGTTFHRVMSGFMIQGGDPLSKDKTNPAIGTGMPGYRIKAEFNARPHKRGTLSMARMNMPDTAGSQFFICVADVPQLDGQYTVFGEVVSGMEVVDKIVSLQVPGTESPGERVEMQVKVIESK